MDDGFVRPDFNAPLDLNKLLAQIPETAKVKGMFFHSAINQARELGCKAPGREKYTAFQDYTVREHVQVLVDCAKLIHPRLPVREGVRRLGREGYRAFASSMFGKVFFSLAARSFEAAIRLTGKAYGTVGSTSSAEVIEESPKSVIIHLRGVWNLPECYHIGVFEGALTDYRKEGEVLLRQHAIDDAELRMVWR